MIEPIQIHDFLVRLPDPLFPYRGRSGIRVCKATAAPPHGKGWVSIRSLSGHFFRSAFGVRNPLNIPGPFYGAETDTCETGPAEAPQDVLLDRTGQEFVFQQPRNEDELRDIISAAICECFVGYGADGDENWTLPLIREWWRSRHDLLAISSGVMGEPESRRRWQRMLSGEGESYLRAYAFFVENRRPPFVHEAVPELG